MIALTVSNVVLWVTVAVLGMVVLALVRQIGVLHERIKPVGALMLRQGLKVGEAAPALTLTTLDDRTISIGVAGGRSTLVMFVSPTCPVCKTLLPVLQSSRLAERDWLDIVLASDGDAVELQRFVADQQLAAFAFVNSTELGLAFQVSRLPFAALLDEQGVVRARGIVNSREHLESLFEAKRRGIASLQDYFQLRAGARPA